MLAVAILLLPLSKHAVKQKRATTAVHLSGALVTPVLCPGAFALAYRQGAMHRNVPAVSLGAALEVSDRVRCSQSAAGCRSCAAHLLVDDPLEGSSAAAEAHAKLADRGTRLHLNTSLDSAAKAASTSI